MILNDALAPQPQAPVVPASYAEKAMASLMQLHSELMDEKERRVELFRQLMEREQSLAELKLYVKLLEEKVGATAAVPASGPAAPVVEPSRPRQAARAAARSPIPVPAVAPRARPSMEGWKTW